MHLSEMMKKEIYRAILLKHELDLPEDVVGIIIDGEETCSPFNADYIIARMFDMEDIEYEYIKMPDYFVDSLEEYVMDYNYSLETIYSFPGLAIYKNHPLYQEIVMGMEFVYRPTYFSSGDLIDFVHFSSSTFSRDKNEKIRQFALQDRTAFCLGIQNNGGITMDEFLGFLLRLKHTIGCIAQLTK